MEIRKLALAIFLFFASNLFLGASDLNFIKDDLKKRGISGTVSVENDKEIKIVIGQVILKEGQLLSISRYDNARYTWVIYSSLLNNLANFKNFLKDNPKLEFLKIVTFPYCREFKLKDLVSLLENSNTQEGQNILLVSDAVVNISTLTDLQARY